MDEAQRLMRVMSNKVSGNTCHKQPPLGEHQRPQPGAETPAGLILIKHIHSPCLVLDCKCSTDHCLKLCKRLLIDMCGWSTAFFGLGCYKAGQKTFRYKRWQASLLLDI